MRENHRDIGKAAQLKLNGFIDWLILRAANCTVSIPVIAENNMRIPDERKGDIVICGKLYFEILGIARKEEAIEYIREFHEFHDLRHTYVMLSLQSGCDIKTLSANLGHATVAFTLDRYGHISEEMMQQSSIRMQHVIDGIQADCKR